MKLVTRGYLFIGIPLAIQLIITGILLSVTENLEQTVSREATAKSVLSAASQLHYLLAEATATIYSLRYTDSTKVRSTAEALLERNRKLSAELRSLAKKEPDGAPTINAFTDSAEHMADLLIDATGARVPRTDAFSFAYTMTEDEFHFEFLTALRRGTYDWRRLHEQFSAIAKEATPEGIKQQENLRLYLQCALGVNILVAIGLAALFGRVFVGRLSILMTNIEDFASGRIELREVPGNDEISILNEKFRVMAKQRIAAEQERQAVLQMVSHDIRGPMTSLNLTLNSIVGGYLKLTMEQVMERLKRVLRETRRLAELCTTFLDLESFQSGQLDLEKTNVKIQDLLESARDSTEGLKEVKQVEVEVQCKPDDTVFCDQERITQVLINILSNAIKFSPRGSVVQLIGEIHDGYVTLSVKDTGPGISESDAKRVFDKFSQLQNARSHGGSGLGLWICQRLVDIHGGTIGCESEIGKGTTFWLKLPAQDESETEDQAPVGIE